eukprot:TRINITY_DN9882_c0_g1_i1.p1 TRINITY_DN9882_c0_g1~~TRINITY_DN9882_c0_g1_i1.p1  ORF type:complete len:765 (+),score=146.03 TRINITY_DN9882_c0_g1_i1:161-2455(+)
MYPFGPIPTLKEVEGADYQPIVNKRNPQLSNRYRRNSRPFIVLQWILLALIGIVLASLYRGINAAIEAISELRMEHLAETVQDGDIGMAWTVNFFSSLGLVLVAVLFALRAPAAISSGMPEIISYLNGAKPDQLLSLPTMGAKIVGLITAVSSGLAIGPEGPTIHLGATIGPRLVEAFAYGCRLFGLSGETVRFFFDDLDMRKLVVAGSAAGIAVAFRAPIGGVFFVIEEAISFFDAQLVFRTYFTCIVAYYFLEILYDGHVLDADTFTPYDIQVECDAPYLAEDGLLFITLGILCGVAGSLFNFLNLRVAKARRSIIGPSGWRRLLEVVVIVLITSLCVVFVPSNDGCTPITRVVEHVPVAKVDAYKFTSNGRVVLDDRGVCLVEPAFELYRIVDENLTLVNKTAEESFEQVADELAEYLRLRQGGCEPLEYSQLGSLFYNTGHHAVNLLFQTGTYDLFSADTLAVFFCVYFVLATVTAGASFPSGLVIPMLTMGGSLGRLFGLGVNSAFRTGVDGVAPIDPGAFAMIGAAAFWCGSGAMTATIAIIILEVTGDFQYLPAIAVAVITANLVGSAINHSLYHSLIHLKHIPFLEDTPDDALDGAAVDAIMARPVVCMHEQATAEEINTALATKHNGFPVVKDDEDGVTRLQGLILRRHLLLAKSQDSLQASKAELDLCSYVNTTPSHVLPHTTLAEAFRMFRSQGLRHLVVVDIKFQVVGMLTRKDFQKAEHLDEHASTVMHAMVANGSDGGLQDAWKQPETHA